MHRSVVIGRGCAPAATCRPSKRRLIASCAAARRDVAANFASTAVSAPKAADLNSSSTAHAKQPYRVSDTTIEDIKAFHKSQLCEYDYLVDGSWVRMQQPGMGQEVYVVRHGQKVNQVI